MIRSIALGYFSKLCVTVLAHLKFHVMHKLIRFLQVYAVTWMIWVVGMSLLPVLAWLCSDWYLIGLVTSVPALSLFLYLWVLPESPRWLMSMGKHEQAAEILWKISKSNGRSEYTSLQQLNGNLRRLIAKQNRKKESKNIGVWTLFSRKRLARNTTLLTISW